MPAAAWCELLRLTWFMKLILLLHGGKIAEVICISVFPPASESGEDRSALGAADPWRRQSVAIRSFGSLFCTKQQGLHDPKPVRLDLSTTHVYQRR